MLSVNINTDDGSSLRLAIKIRSIDRDLAGSKIKIVLAISRFSGISASILAPKSLKLESNIPRAVIVLITLAVDDIEVGIIDRTTSPTFCTPKLDTDVEVVSCPLKLRVVVSIINEAVGIWTLVTIMLAVLEDIVDNSRLIDNWLNS
jgi:hypothetical protein